MSLKRRLARGLGKMPDREMAKLVRKSTRGLTGASRQLVRRKMKTGAA